MARPRSALHLLLEGFVGSKRAYFQPKQNTSIDYPCIVYSRDNSYILNADNLKYVTKKRYQITVIDRNPDSTIPDQVENLPYSRFDRAFITDGLNHTVFNVYF